MWRKAIRTGVAETPWEQLVGGVVLGSARFMKTVRRHLRGNEKEQAPLRQLKPPADGLLHIVPSDASDAG